MPVFSIWILPIQYRVLLIHIRVSNYISPVNKQVYIKQLRYHNKKNVLCLPVSLMFNTHV